MSATRRISIGLILFLLMEAVLFAFVDLPVSEWARGIDKTSPEIINIFRAYTDFGKSFWYLWPSGVAVFICAIFVRQKSLDPSTRKHSKRIGEFCLFLFLAVASSGIVTDIIKPILGRARPVEWERDGQYGFFPLTFDAKWNAMPSGHGTTAFTLFLVFAHAFPRLQIPAFMLAVALMLSRIMVNAHYVSDVVAGAGVAYVCVVWLVALNTKNGIFHIKQRIFPIDARGP